MSLAENKAIATRFYDEVINRGSAAALDELISAGYVEHGTPAQAPGREGFRAFLQMIGTAFPDIHVTVEELLAEDDRVVARLTVRGTHLGPLQGAAPTGKPATWWGLDLLEIGGGQITGRWSLRDLPGLMRQLGLA